MGVILKSLSKATILIMVSIQTVMFVKLPSIRSNFFEEEKPNWFHYFFFKKKKTTVNKMVEMVQKLFRNKPRPPPSYFSLNYLTNKIYAAGNGLGRGEIVNSKTAYDSNSFLIGYYIVLFVVVISIKILIK